MFTASGGYGGFPVSQTTTASTSSWQPPASSWKPPSQSYQPPTQAYQPPTQAYQPSAASSWTPSTQAYQPPASSWTPSTQAYQQQPSHAASPWTPGFQSFPQTVNYEPQPTQFIPQTYNTPSGTGGFLPNPLKSFKQTSEETPIYMTSGNISVETGYKPNKDNNTLAFEKRTQFKLRKGKKPNTVSPEFFDETMMKTIKEIRAEQCGGTESRICYLPAIRCTGTTCGRIMSDADVGSYQDIFFELIDPDGPYKLSTAEAYEELGIEEKCCKRTLRSPTILSWEPYYFDRRYAEGMDINIRHDKASLSRVRNMRVAYRLDSDKIATQKPKIQVTEKYVGMTQEERIKAIQESELKEAIRKKELLYEGKEDEKIDKFKREVYSGNSNIDYDSQLILAPGSSVVGYVDLNDKVKVPVVASLIKLTKK